MDWIVTCGYGIAFVVSAIFFQITLIFLHELGHLAAAWLIGWEPFVFRVGAGPRLAAFRLGYKLA